MQYVSDSGPKKHTKAVLIEPSLTYSKIMAKIGTFNPKELDKFVFNPSTSDISKNKVLIDEIRPRFSLF